MNKFKLTAEEQSVFDRVASNFETLPEASQYNVLRNLSHFMNREVVKIGAVRSAAAVAGSTARIASEGRNLPVGARSAPKRRSRKARGYPVAFLEGPGKEAFELQQSCRKALSEPPTEEERRLLREASSELRENFRRFNEAGEESED